MCNVDYLPADMGVQNCVQHSNIVRGSKLVENELQLALNVDLQLVEIKEIQ